MANTYLTYAQTAAEILTSRWFQPTTPGHWVPNDYWRTPTICEELVDYMSVTGESTFMSTVENARTAGEPWIGSCGYYDDETCWGRLFVTTYAYLTSGGSGADPQNYLSDAVKVHDDLVAGWDDTCGGGIWWRRRPKGYPGNFKASNSTLGSMEIALGLYGATKDGQYLQWAQKVWAWLQASGMIEDGLVWGGLDSSCGVDPNNKPVVALQGNPLGPLWRLYAATGDTSALDAAQAIADAALVQMVWSGTQILQAGADAQWNQQTQEWREQNSGETPFKGIFAGYLGDFARNLATVQDPARQQAAQKYADALRANSDALWANFPGQVFGMDWHTSQPQYQPNPDDVINASLQYSALSAFVGAAMNS
jgi:predicted alpha-1,6-mannanase (GH76 family)